MSYFTTSLMPTGNRLVTDALCPAAPMPASPYLTLPSVQVEPTFQALGWDETEVDASARTVHWIVGAPAAHKNKNNTAAAAADSNTSTAEEEDRPSFWLQMDNGDQYQLSYTENGTSIAQKGEFKSPEDRPLILYANATDSGIMSSNTTITTTTDAVPFLPMEPPPHSTSSSSYVLSQYSAAVPTPNGGWLFLQQTTASANPTPVFQITQLSPNGTDVTHESLRDGRIIDPLPDAQFSCSNGGGAAQKKRWALYTHATNVYDHGILGDAWEGLALTVLQWNAATHQVEFLTQVNLEDGEDDEEGTVFEGLTPMWANVQGFGGDDDDIVTTVSNRAVGARMRVYSVVKGDDDPIRLSILAQAPAIGLGGRWLHQLAVGPFSTDGRVVELVEIRTPHIGGIVRYYRLGSGELELVASSTSQYTSHDIGKRNLDRVVVGDFNGDGIPELVVQTQDKTSLVGLQRANDANDEGIGGVKEVWSIPLPSPVYSNLAVSCSNSDGTMEILFATESLELVKIQFAPAMIHDEDDEESLVQRSGASSSSSGAAAARWWSLSKLVLCLPLVWWD